MLFVFFFFFLIKNKENKLKKFYIAMYLPNLTLMIRYVRKIGFVLFQVNFFFFFALKKIFTFFFLIFFFFFLSKKKKKTQTTSKKNFKNPI